MLEPIDISVDISVEKSRTYYFAVGNSLVPVKIENPIRLVRNSTEFSTIETRTGDVVIRSNWVAIDIHK